LQFVNKINGWYGYCTHNEKTYEVTMNYLVLALGLMLGSLLYRVLSAINNHVKERKELESLFLNSESSN
jgi:uncharacterized membrane protein YjjB (DUF3815 family)